MSLLSASAHALDQAINCIGGERSAALGREDETVIGKLPPQLPQRPDLVAPERVNGRLAVLGPANMQRCRSAKLDLRPFQIADLDCPETMPEGDYDQRSIAVTITTIARRFDQLLDLGLGQIFPRPQLGIGWPDRN
jgi:hypothetical protein